MLNRDEIVAQVLAFDCDVEAMDETGVMLEATGAYADGEVELGFTLPKKLPSGARVYLRVDVHELLRVLWAKKRSTR